MKRMKRAVSWLMALVMVFSLLPTAAFAAADGDPVVVIAGSDYQASDSGTTMSNIAAQIKKEYASPFGILMGGDYDAGIYNANNVGTTADDIEAVDDVIDKVFPDIAADNRIYIQGNHENFGGLKVDGTNLMNYTGYYETDYYGVYAINHDDFPWSGSSSTLVQGTADDLEVALTEKKNAGYKKPIFVMSHLPLHYTNRGDNDYASLIFDVLNEAGKTLNIIFLFGHNHSTAYDSYLGQNSIYLKKGDAIKVAKDDGKSYNSETLNFTYMNYGYVGYTGSTNADATLTMTAFEISDNEVAVKRYSTNGQHTLKAAGGNTQLPSGLSVNSDVYGQAVISLTDGTSTISEISADSGSGDNNTGSGDNSGTIGGSGYTYELVTSIEAGEKYVIVGNDHPVALMDNNGSFGSQTVTISGTTLTSDVALTEWTISGTDNGTIISDANHQLGYDNSAWGLVTGGTVQFDITANNGNFKVQMQRGYNNYNFYYDGTDWTDKSTSDHYVRLYKLTGTGSGGGSVDTEGGDWVTVTEPDGGTTTYTYKQATSITANGKYVIVGYEDDVALINDNGDFGSVTDVNISGTTMTSTTELTEWTFSGSSQGSVSDGSDYLYSSGNGYTFRIDGEDTLYFTDKGDYFVIDGASSNRSTYAFYYNGSDWATSNNREQYVRLFQLSGTTPGDDATPGLFAKITGKLEYNVERGLTAEQVLDLVQAEIKGYKYEGTAAPGDDVTGTEITEELEFVLDSNYNGAKAGEYAVAIKYNDVTLGTAKVIVPEVAISGYGCQTSGSVKVGATGKVRTGANITVNLEDGTSYTVPVTMDMLSGDFTTAEGGTYTGLTVTYNGVVVCKDFTLTVRGPSPYPEYPDEGAVKVNKTATGIQFQSTGVAQVELSASGIPMNQGVDVLLILDTSSSMGEAGSLTSGTRMSVLQECVNALIQSLKAERADGSVPDVDFSVVDFAGYLDYKSVNYIESAAKSTSEAQRGAVLLDWTNVQNVSSTWGNGLTEKSGTNYDHGLQMGYDQLSAKQVLDNGSRKQFVLFMSDGAPFQYNGVGSSEVGKGNAFEKWLLGTYTQDEVDALKGDHFNNPEFYFESEGDAQKNRIAEAIKGSANETFYIPSYTEVDGEWTGELVGVPGLGSTMYSVGYALVEDYDRNPTGLDGMNAILKTIASTSEETGEKLFYSVKVKEDLEACFDDFAGEALMAATNARFVDQMGAQYDLQMGQILDLNDQPVGVENKIEILSYDIWTRSDYLAGKCTADKIGDRKGTSTVLETITFNADGSEAYSDKASVGPNGEAIAAGANILHAGVIYASSFWYNSNATAVAITGVNIPTGVDANGLTTGSTNMLPAETFYWNIGTIKTTELAMRYYVYLEGSMEGTCEPGSYPTNEYALLYYNNYLNQPIGQPCQKPTFSPTLAWEAANVSYAFYLVDENGNIIVNQTTGETGSFANKIAVTNPVVYEEVLLNNEDTVESIEVASLGVLPDGYELYDSGAVYTIEINSDATGSWTIAKGDNKKATTYVTHFDLDDSSAYTNELTKNSDADFTHTVVWFAVLWKIQALPDSVVVDFGLPVDISVLTNDMFGEAGKLAGVGAYSDSLNLDGHTITLASGFANEYKADASAEDMMSYGDAKADTSTGKVRYTPSTMEMNGYDKFAYAVNYTGATNPGYYYDTVTVIPATTIYYEDSFVDFDNLEWTSTGTNVWDGYWAVDESANGSRWQPVGDQADVTQDEDRPGKYSLTDANNIYGFDGVNKGMTTYSLGSAMKATVAYNHAAQASFTFWGTGFDIISMTDTTTGTILVDVYPVNTDGTLGASAASLTVDTYYGYKQEPGDANGDDIEDTNEMIWVVDPDADDAIWQVPVMKVENLTYGHYKAVIRAVYDTIFDHAGGEEDYDFYLDAIRIYDPANDGAVDNDTVIEDAYKADGEGWPSYIELRNQLIDAEKLLGDFNADTNGNGTVDANEKITGMVFIDGDDTVGNDQIADYISYGPNNEVYLAKGQSVVFLLNVPANIDNVHIGIKSANGVAGSYTMKNIAAADEEVDGKTVKAGTPYNEKLIEITTTTDMYYDMTGWKNDIIVITNTGEGILSLTNIKSTYTSDPKAATPVMETYDLRTVAAEEAENTGETTIYMTPAAATLTLRSLNAPVVPETPVEPEQPEEPETPVEPEQPEKPETPEEPEQPEEPEEPETPELPQQPSYEETVKTVVKKIVKTIKSLLSWLFK
ncbi:MAG: VWA domain-containing protein [Ruminococcaceae bacterium]|nr:VWA domain-containing protein [Oscillospiraceae bacterium]